MKVIILGVYEQYIFHSPPHNIWISLFLYGLFNYDISAKNMTSKKRMINANNYVENNCHLIWGRHYLLGIFLEGRKENTKIFREDSQSPGRDLNHGPTETM
jgi:hypothetical protein